VWPHDRRSFSQRRDRARMAVAGALAVRRTAVKHYGRRYVSLVCQYASPMTTKTQSVMHPERVFWPRLASLDPGISVIIKTQLLGPFCAL